MRCDYGKAKGPFRGVSSSSYPMNVSCIEDDLPRIEQVTASYQKGTMVVDFKE
jgi:hypothetical protein